MATGRLHSWPEHPASYYAHFLLTRSPASLKLCSAHAPDSKDLGGWHWITNSVGKPWGAVRTREIGFGRLCISAWRVCSSRLDSFLVLSNCCTDTGSGVRVRKPGDSVSTMLVHTYCFLGRQQFLINPEWCWGRSVRPPASR